MNRTLRILMPQWQGGCLHEYTLGAHLLAWLAPSGDETIEIPIEPHCDLAMEDGTYGRYALLKQLRDAKNAIYEKDPDRIITFGGDCLVSVAPLSYLNGKYDGIGVLWFDAHPDVSTAEMCPEGHTMTLGVLMGGCDEEFASEVDAPLDPENVLHCGIQDVTSAEADMIGRFGLANVTSDELMVGSDAVIAWMVKRKIKHLAIHIDIDVIDPLSFRSVRFGRPDGNIPESPGGKLTMERLSGVIHDASEIAEVVGITFAEHVPWDAVSLRDFMHSLPLFK